MTTLLLFSGEPLARANTCVKGTKLVFFRPPQSNGGVYLLQPRTCQPEETGQWLCASAHRLLPQPPGHGQVHPGNGMCAHCTCTCTCTLEITCTCTCTCLGGNIVMLVDLLTVHVRVNGYTSQSYCYDVKY